MKVAILGASPEPERYANKAQKLLLRKGHEVYPVTPRYPEVDGIAAYKSPAELPDGIDTLTLYVGPDRIKADIEKIVAKRPRRIIMNPGAESLELQKAAEAAGIEVIEACTLVLLNTNQF